MRLRSAQFVLLVLLFSSLGLSERSSLSLADELLGKATGILLSQRAATSSAFDTTPRPAAAVPPGRSRLAPAHQQALSHPWTMPHPAAQAAALQAVTANARA